MCVVFILKLAIKQLKVSIYRPLVELTKCFTDYFNILHNFSKELHVLPDDDR
jgi:hypothetical protein